MKVFAELEVAAERLDEFFKHILGHDGFAKVTVNHPAPPSPSAPITVKGGEHPASATPTHSKPK